ncbi:hypothetical protein JHK82_027666 [Glycine max]|nr:hypothetical protein JHK82_027666 [Glycine max]
MALGNGYQLVTAIPRAAKKRHQREEKSASTLASVIMLTSILLGGYCNQHVPKFIAWLKYFSTHYYVYHLVIGSRYGISDTYPCSNGQCMIAEHPVIKQVGLHLQGKIMAALALFVMLIGYRLVAYFSQPYDEPLDSKFRRTVTRTQSASISISMSSLESYEKETSLVGHTDHQTCLRKMMSSDSFTVGSGEGEYIHNIIEDP